MALKTVLNFVSIKLQQINQWKNYLGPLKIDGDDDGDDDGDKEINFNG